VEPASTEARRRDLISPLIAGYAAVHVALGAWQLSAPGSFFDAIGPFGTSNAHYTRDVGTFTLALGIAFAIAYRWRAWRPGVVGYAFLQYLLHAGNHLADIDAAHPKPLGPIDFALLSATCVVLGWMLAQVLRQARTAAS
jgi:hypothetical protein